MTIRPLSRSRMPGSTALVHRNAPVAFTSNWARQNQKWPGGITQGQSEANAIKRVVAELNDTVTLGLMEFVAKNDLTHLTDAEIAALYAYLVARAKRLGS